jgi:ABC-2 type transport system permease protein
VIIFLLQFAGELRKLFARPRTYLGFVAFAIVELLMPFLLELDAVKGLFRGMIEQMGKSFDEYFSALTLALIVMRATVFLIGALFIAMVAGDIVSKEVEDGALRMLLSRPVSRFRILALKYLSTVVYTTLLAFFIGLASLGASLLYEHPGGFFVFGIIEHIYAFHDFEPGLWRYLAVLPLLALTLLTINSTAFFFSCLNMKPAAATICTLSIFFVDYVLHGLPFFEPLESYFIAPRLSAWMHVFDRDLHWQPIAENYILLLAADLTLFVLGWMSFERRDFKA